LPENDIDERVGSNLAQTTYVEGVVESITHWGAMGWAWMPTAPEHALQVEAVAGGAVIGVAIANELREDIARSGKGNGCYGFRLRFDQAPPQGSAPSVRVLTPNGPAPIFGAELSSVEGYIDSLTRLGASGWAWAPSEPDRELEIEAVSDGKVIGRATANQFRSDIADVGKGTGRYGFRLKFHHPITDDKAPSLRIKGSNGPIAFNNVGNIQWSSVEGYVDSLTKWGAVGWAWMPALPDESVEIEAVADGKVIGRALANQKRNDMLEDGRGTGLYGFTLAFNEPFTGHVPPLLRALGPDGPTQLRSNYSLASFDPPPELDAATLASSQDQDAASEALELGIEGHVDYLSRWVATGWVWLPSAPEMAANIHAVLDGRVVGRAIADQMRPDLLEYGKGTGRYGFVLGFDEPLTGSKPPLILVVGPEGSARLPGADQLPPEEVESEPQPPPQLLSQPPSAKAVAIEGGVDYVTRRGAKGWAWAPLLPDAAMRIEAVLDGRVIGRTTADQNRPDLLEYGKGTGLYGWSLSFDEHVTGPEPPVFHVLAPLADGLPCYSTLPALTADDLKNRSRGSVATLMKQRAEFTNAGPKFEQFDPDIIGKAPIAAAQNKPLILAFYLPQFHAIAENDIFWGKGFTEWRQLPKGISRFPGHYQPRIPRDLGFYNLENPKALEAQAALAKAGGVGAFAYYYYWFNRKRVLEKPLDMLLESDVDMPFLIIWANENWTRTWDGSESAVLLKQDYNIEDEEVLLADLARHFRDPRYVRLGTRPLFIIYNPKNIPETVETIARWRAILVSKFDVDPLIFSAQTFGAQDPRVFGLDGAIEFPPHKLADHLPARETPDAYAEDFAGLVFAYDDFVTTSLSEDGIEFPLIKTIVPSWDNDCRRPNRGLTLEASSPEKYEAWLRALILRAIDKPIFDTPLVAVNAWNEWAEGAYLEPDVYFGSAYLNATARAYVSAITRDEYGSSRNLIPPNYSPKVTVILPNYNHSKYLPERLASVIQQSSPPDEIIFLDDCSSDDSVDVARAILEASQIPFRIIVNTQNSGCVFRQWVKGIGLAKNELIWIAETDDTADLDFLKHILPPFFREDIMASFGWIRCIDPDGTPRNDLDGYYRTLNDFCWSSSRVVAAYKAFSHDFAIKNVIPNASGLVFRKPRLNDDELQRLYNYRFAGDWYFYALIARGGAIAYSKKARSYFRVNQASTSRSAFFTEQHLAEHRMIIADLSQEYGIGDEIIDAHSDELAVHFTKLPKTELRQRLDPDADAAPSRTAVRVLMAADSFTVGGGEVLPLELCNELKRRGYHVTYLVIDRPPANETRGIRSRLRSDVPVVFWDDVASSFDQFLQDYGIELINSHNVSVDYRFYYQQTDFNIPYIASLHGGYEMVAHLLTEDVVAYLNRTVTKWLSLSQKNTKILEMKGVSPETFQESFNAVPRLEGPWTDRALFRAEHGIPSDAFALVLCSRAISEKGWQTAIDVAAELGSRHARPIHLVLIGDGPAAKELSDKYRHWNFVHFMGHVDNPQRLFRCFDLGIFPSTFGGETFPLFILECFQAGLPVVSTDIGEIPRLICGVDGVSPGATASWTDTPEQIRRTMVDEISKILTDQSEYSRMCASATAAAERFSIERLADLYEDVFRTAIEAKSQILVSH
jgi:glycosyltransferase involved in cell wall biosynthesis